LPSLVLSKQAAEFLRGLPSKPARQIAEKLKALAEDSNVLPSELLRGYAPMRRLKSGEYRIIFVVDADVVHIRLIGKRNDDEVYKALGRSMVPDKF
jgi:mRNA interferase RelE/StbE